jgi:hypothetical protein
VTTSGNPLGQGTMNTVSRCGAWVLRPAGPHTPFVQELLAVLAGAGCEWAPRPGGLAPDGRERVSFVPGLADWELRARGGDPYAERPLLQAMRWVRRLHDLTAGTGTGPAQEVTCHGDLGPHNLVYTPAGEASGLIDFDLASRGRRADDLATAVKELARLGAPGPTERQVQTAVRLLDAYGWDALDVDDVLGTVPKAFTDDLTFCVEQADAGNPFYERWARSDEPDALRARADRAAALLPDLRAAARRAAALRTRPAGTEQSSGSEQG